MPVIDLKNDKEWDDAGVIACCTNDFKQMWVPWDSNNVSLLKMSYAMFYEKEMRVRAESKLSEWQLWWQAGGRNSFSELPPVVPPPPSAAAAAEPTASPKSPPPLPAPAFPPPPPAVPAEATPCATAARVAMGPQPPSYPPPGKAAIPKAPVASPRAVPAVAPVPAPAGAPASSSAPKASGPAVVNPQGELNTGWKGKMCALLGAMEMNLPQRVRYLSQKFLVNLCENKPLEPMLATITCTCCKRHYAL